MQLSFTNILMSDAISRINHSSLHTRKSRKCCADYKYTHSQSCIIGHGYTTTDFLVLPEIKRKYVNI